MIVEHQVFQWSPGGSDQLFEWDITEAIAARDRGEVESWTIMEREQMESIRDNNDWTQARVDEADITIRGIAAPIINVSQIIYILIDGSHRCVRALQDGKPFEVDLLTDEAAINCQLPPSRELWTVRHTDLDRPRAAKVG